MNYFKETLADVCNVYSNGAVNFSDVVQIQCVSHLFVFRPLLVYRPCLLHCVTLLGILFAGCAAILYCALM